jgi:hypothetical protein
MFPDDFDLFNANDCSFPFASDKEFEKFFFNEEMKEEKLDEKLPVSLSENDSFANSSVEIPNRIELHTTQQKSNGRLSKEARKGMNDWLLLNYIDPYPTENQKEKFVQMYGLSLEKVNTYLVNQRRRLLNRRRQNCLFSNI